MIHEVDEALRLLLVDAGLEDSGVDLVFDAPTKDWSARRNAPTVSVFLYGIREDATRRSSGTSEEYDAEGVVTGRRTPARWFELTYRVTAWTN
ncbi:Pvc16 family protein, partial [Streptomyces sp. DT225]